MKGHGAKFERKQEEAIAALLTNTGRTQLRLLVSPPRILWSSLLLKTRQTRQITSNSLIALIRYVSGSPERLAKLLTKRIWSLLRRAGRPVFWRATCCLSARPAEFGCAARGYLLDSGHLQISVFANSLYLAKSAPTPPISEPVLRADLRSTPALRTSGAPSPSSPRAPVCSGLQIRLSTAH